MRATRIVRGLVACALLAGGCKRGYTVRTDDLRFADELRRQGVDDDHIAIAAVEDSTGAKLRLRLSRVDVSPALARSGEPMPVSAADSRRERRAGLGFTIFGAILILADALALGPEMAANARCARTPGCYGEDYAYAIYGPTLAINGFAALSIGIPLLVDGFHRRADVAPTDRSLVDAVAEPAPAP